MFVIYSTIQYSNQLLYCYNIKNKPKICRNYKLSSYIFIDFKTSIETCSEIPYLIDFLLADLLESRDTPLDYFLCQLTCQSADIMSSLCGVGVRVRVRVRVRVNNFFSKTTRPRDMLFFLKDTLSIEDEKLFKACKSVYSSVC